MLKVQLAGLKIAIDNHYDYIVRYCRDYLCEFETADFTVSATEAEIASEDKENEGYTMGYLETLAIYRKIAEKLVDREGFLMHGVIMDTNDCGIALLAKSGVGKSTHCRMWTELLGDKLTIVNGDKPLIRFDGGIPYAYGTPWAGKEGIQTNTRTPLKKVCFIQRAEENRCTRLDKKSALPRLMVQIYRMPNTELYLKTLDLVSRLVEHVEFYLIECTPAPAAAETAYKTLFEHE